MEPTDIHIIVSYEEVKKSPDYGAFMAGLVAGIAVGVVVTCIAFRWLERTDIRPVMEWDDWDME